MRNARLLVFAALILGGSVMPSAQTATQNPPQSASAAKYLLPPKEIVDILDAPLPPAIELSPTRDIVAVLEGATMPTIADLSRPVLRLGGRRINPRTNGPHRAQLFKTITLKSTIDTSEKKVAVPSNGALTWISFSPDGKRFAFSNTRDSGIDLWVGETATGQAKALTTAQLNASLGTPCEWVADGASLLCSFVPPNRANPPAAPTVPPGPNVQENRAVKAPVRTYQDLLTSAYDEALFDYYASGQLGFVDATSGQRSAVGSPAIFETMLPSPDGNYVLVGRVHRPY